MTVTTHTIEAELPTLGKTDITFNFIPGKPGRHFSADLEVLRAVPRACTKDVTVREMRDIAQEHLDDGGYDSACSIAREQRGDSE